MTSDRTNISRGVYTISSAVGAAIAESIGAGEEIWVCLSDDGLSLHSPEGARQAGLPLVYRAGRPDPLIPVSEDSPWEDFLICAAAVILIPFAICLVFALFAAK